MFKRLLNALRGKSTAPDATVEADAGPPDLDGAIEAVDADGNAVQIERDVWVSQVLPHNLQLAWDDPDVLYQHILGALNDKLADALESASLRLMEIDPYPERACTMRSIVLMETGRLDEAEQMLLDCIARLGEHCVMYTNLAKVHAERNDDPRTEAALQKAIELDPNYPNSLGWYSEIVRERDGDAAYVQVLEHAGTLPGSWRPQLWLGRHHLQQGNVDAALALYLTLLAGTDFTSDALVQLSGDLGMSDNVTHIPELLAPAYDMDQHNPQVGLNLLKAYYELGRREEGEALLARMRALPSDELMPYLDDFAERFRALPV